MNSGISTTSAVAGFLPSTVCHLKNHGWNGWNITSNAHFPHLSFHGNLKVPAVSPPLKEGHFLRPKNRESLKACFPPEGGNPSLPNDDFPFEGLTSSPSTVPYKLYVFTPVGKWPWTSSVPRMGWDEGIGGGLLFGGLGFMVTRRETRRILGEKVLSERNVQRWIFWGAKISSDCRCFWCLPCSLW